MVTRAQVDRFLRSGWDYTEQRLSLLVRASEFAITPTGVDRLTELHRRMVGMPEATFEQALATIYRDPVYPIYQHVGQAFRNQVAGRQPFVLHSLSRLASPSFRLCDAGCGAGILLGDVLEAYPQSYAFGVDVSAVMLQHAQRVLSRWSLKRQMTLVNADVRGLPFSPGQFEAVMALEVLEHLPEPGIGLSELVRVLRPEGWLLTSVPVQSPAPGHLYLFRSPQDVIEFHLAAGLDVADLQVEDTAPGIPDVRIAARRARV